MAKRSLKASEKGQEIAKKAFERTGWTQEYLAAEVGLSTRQSVWKFFKGKPIERHIFIDLCFQLNLEWEDVADFPGKAALDIPSKITLESSIDQLVSNAIRLLSGRILAQCGTVQSSVEFAQPLALETIYTDVNLLTNLSNQRWLEVADFQNNSPITERLNFNSTQSQTIRAIETIKSGEKLAILGKPGAGKTTFLQHLALECIRGQLVGQWVPVFISLRIFVIYSQKTADFSLLNYIQEVWQNHSLNSEDVLTLLQEGKLLILLDGLDEISLEYESEILEQIQQFSKTYYQNPLVVTCRLAAQQYRFQGFRYLEIADFNDSQIENFARKWFIATATEETVGIAKAKQFLEHLHRKENQPLRELVGTPILLNLICSVFQERLSFSTKRSRLYQEGLDILLVRWDRSRGIERDKTYQNLALSDKIKLLSQIAADNFIQGNYFFEKDQVIQTISEYLLTLPDTNPDPETLRLDSEAVLRAIEVQHGLLIERARGIYSFSHLTFQEYLTARKIVSSPNPENLSSCLDKLASCLTHPQWREVILLTGSMLPNGDYLMEQIQDNINQIVRENSFLQEFLTFLNKKVTSLNLSYQSPALRAFYFSLFYHRDLNIAIALDHKLAGNLAEELALDLALNRSLSSAISLVDNPDIKQILDFSFGLELDKTFTLTPEMCEELEQLKQQLPDFSKGKNYLLDWWQSSGQDWVRNFRSWINQHRYDGQDWNFSLQQKELLQKYYLGLQFAIECLHSDSKISPEIKSKIETQLLTI